MSIAYVVTIIVTIKIHFREFQVNNQSFFTRSENHGLEVKIHCSCHSRSDKFIHGNTRGLTKYPKIDVTDIGHLHEYAYGCQNTPFQFSP